MNVPVRELLIYDVAKKAGVSRPAAAAAVDQVLDEVLAMATPKLENDWAGGAVLQTLQRWRGRRP